MFISRNVASLALVALVFGHTAARCADELGPRITVVGAGEASAKPDMAEVVVGVVTQDKSAGDALAANNRAMTSLIDTIKRAGVDAPDMQTQGLNLSPRYERGNPQGGSPRIVGYQVTNQVVVKVRDLARLGKLLDDVVTSGANSIQGISFSIAEPDALRDSARRKAMQKAKSAAQLLAGEGQARLGKLLKIEEESTDQPRPFMRQFAAAEASSAVPIEAGQYSVHARIVVTFELKADGN